MKRGYKVTDKEGGSVIQHEESGGVCYKVGEPTVPQDGCGPLTVFKTKKGAQFFRKHLSNDSTHLFICRYKPSVLDAVWHGYHRLSLLNLLHANESCILPNTVALADEVVLKEEIVE